MNFVKKNVPDKVVQQIKEKAAQGMTLRDISLWVKEVYNISINKDTVNSLISDVDVIKAKRRIRKKQKTEEEIVQQFAETVIKPFVESSTTDDLTKLSQINSNLERLFKEKIEHNNLDDALRIAAQYHKFLSLSLKAKGIIKEVYDHHEQQKQINSVQQADQAIDDLIKKYNIQLPTDNKDN